MIFEFTEWLLLNKGSKLAQELPEIEKHDFLLQKCKAQTIEFTKKFRLKGNTPHTNKLKHELRSICNDEIESQIQLLVNKDHTDTIKNWKI